MTNPNNAVTRVSDAGEILMEQGNFKMSSYLLTLDEGAFAHQQALAAAYDRACKSLVGPNDVQIDGPREFKKKSAWRKLGRAFNISITSELKDVRIDHFSDGKWVAIAHASAVAPWGQRFDDVGACGNDEEEGQREITFADAIATAMTRASNRAVSNLIAMGEVSAEEIGNRKSTPARASAEPVAKCPQCGGKMWDNRKKKADGTFSATAPDMVCRDKCGGFYTVWPPKTAADTVKDGLAAAATSSGSSQTSPDGSTAAGTAVEPTLATEAQLAKIRALMVSEFISDGEREDMTEKLPKLTEAKAAKWIPQLEAIIEAGKKAEHVGR